MLFWIVTAAVFLSLGTLSFRGARWAYFSFVALGLSFFPARVGFRLQPRACDLAIDGPLALASLGNYPHIVLFGIFFLMTSVHLQHYRASVRIPLAAVVVLTLGVCVEVAQGFTGQGHCRLRDLLPDAMGALLGALVSSAWAHHLARPRAAVASNESKPPESSVRR